MKSMSPASHYADLKAKGIESRKNPTRKQWEESQRAKWQPRQRAPGEAPSSTMNIWTSDVYDGAELRPFAGRPGAMDAFALPSAGVRT